MLQEKGIDLLVSGDLSKWRKTAALVSELAVRTSAGRPSTSASPSWKSSWSAPQSISTRALRVSTRNLSSRIRDGLRGTLGARLLQRRGHDVVLVEGGAAAVELTARESFDLILMDVEMPQMDGLEATQLIREREKETGGCVPIIALTAHDMGGQVCRGRHA